MCVCRVCVFAGANFVVEFKKAETKEASLNGRVACELSQVPCVCVCVCVCVCLCACVF